MTAPAGSALTRRLDELYRFERSGMRLGLEGIERLLESGGRPDLRFPSVLIAGTNGKGSTAAHLAAILRAAGLRTGLFTSPHLSRFHERIRIDGKEIESERLDSLLARWWPRFERERPSFFEATTALAFDHFAESEVDLAVVEVGIGGRLDATNILSPRVSVITTISTDHTEILGRTLAQIAAEKAGIVKEQGLVVCGVRGREARRTIGAAAEERGARISWLGADGDATLRRVTPEGTEFRLRIPGFEGVVRTPLLGAHQARNAALAALAAQSLLDGRPSQAVTASIVQGIAATRWPARAERILDEPPVLVDAAHNAEGAAALAATVAALHPGRRIGFVVGLSSDKAHAPFLRALGRVASRFFLTEFAGERATPAAILLRAAPRRHMTCEAVPDVAGALARALAWAREHDGVVALTGSFYLIGEALPILGVEVPREI
jgi:dihydrofolate synthase / folylpolyglutamate synthase